MFTPLFSRPPQSLTGRGSLGPQVGQLADAKAGSKLVGGLEDAAVDVPRQAEGSFWTFLMASSP
jgi:hypothetical protein